MCLTSRLHLIVELNVGGIVAAVLVTLILLGGLIFGIWFAYSRGYFDSKYLPSKALLPAVPMSGLSPGCCVSAVPDAEPMGAGSSPREPCCPLLRAMCWFLPSILLILTVYFFSFRKEERVSEGLRWGLQA